MTGLREKTVHALKWSYLGLLTNLLLQPLLVAILSRLLTPQEFGVAAIGAVLATFGAVLTEMGVGQALVQRRDLTTDHIRAGVTLSVFLGVVVTVLVWVTAPLAGRYFGDAELIPVMRGFALTYVVAALSGVSTSLLRRELRFKPLMISDVSSYVIGHGVLGVGAAFLGFGAMSLVVSAAASWLIQFAVTFTVARPPLRFIFRWAPYRELYGFGSRVSVLHLMAFLSENVATFMIARLYDATAVGLYNRAFYLAGVPIYRLAGALTRVLTSSFSALQDEREKLRRAYASSMLQLSGVLFCLSAGLVVCAPEIVRVLLGERFMAAVPLVQALAVSVPFTVLSNLGGIVAEATARLNIKLALQFTHLLLLVAGFWLVYRLGWGVGAFVWVLVGAEILRAGAYVVVSARILHGGARDSLRAYGRGAAWGLTVGAVLLLIVEPLRSTRISPFALFGLELLVGAALLVIVICTGPDSELRRSVLKVIRFVKSRTGGWLRSTFKLLERT